MIGEAALFELGIMIAALAVVGSIAKYVKESDIPFFILIGIALGPYGIGRYLDFYVGSNPTADQFIELGAELGVIFLLFFMGLSFSLKKLRRQSSEIIGIGTLDLLNFAPGILIGYWFFQDMLAAFLIGGIVYISSSAVISKSIMDLGWESTPEADRMLGGLIFEDLVIIFYLALMSSVLLGDGADVRSIAIDVGIAVIFVVVLVGTMVLKPELYNKILKTESDELFVLRAIGIIGLVAGIAVVLGLSEAVAAFFVGVAFAGSDHLSSLQNHLYSERYLFGGIFFFWIGLETDPLLFRGVGSLLILVVIASSLYKFFTMYYGAKFFDMGPESSTKAGVGMITRGEFSLIVAALASEAVGVYDVPLITETIPAFAVSYVLVMSIVGTILMQNVDKITSRLGLKKMR